MQGTQTDRQIDDTQTDRQRPGDYMTVFGGFGVSGPISEQSLSKSRLMGSVSWKKGSSEILSLLILHVMIFFGSLFGSTLKVIKIGFAQVLGDITRFCLVYRLGS